MLLPALSGAQSPSVRPLSIGDTVPDITITNVYNYPSSTIRLSDLKGKLVILDFWATWCGSCLSAFPEMHELKKTFGNDLNILFVNSFSDDNSAKVKNTFTRLKERSGVKVNLPYILKDSILKLYFPHQFIPHYVWLNSKSKVVAITQRHDVTEENIAAFLNGKTPSMRIKDDDLLFNTDIPLLLKGNGGNPGDFLYRSIFTKYKPGLGHAAGSEINEAGNIKRAYFINTTAISLLKQAFPAINKYSAARTIYEVKDPDKFKSSFDWKKENANSYCYELICRPISEKDLQKYMREDLARFLNVTVRIENRSVTCYALKATARINRSYSKTDSACFDATSKSYIKRFRKQPVSMLIGLLEDILKIPVIDETNDLHNFDLDFPGDVYDFDLKRMNSFLHRNGFDLIPAVRKISVAVISEDPK